jgi:hypothetical protein
VSCGIWITLIDRTVNFPLPICLPMFRCLQFPCNVLTSHLSILCLSSHLSVWPLHILNEKWGFAIYFGEDGVIFRERRDHYWLRHQPGDFILDSIYTSQVELCFILVEHTMDLGAADIYLGLFHADESALSILLYFHSIVNSSRLICFLYLGITFLCIMLLATANLTSPNSKKNKTYFTYSCMLICFRRKLSYPS